MKKLSLISIMLFFIMIIGAGAATNTVTLDNKDKAWQTTATPYIQFDVSCSNNTETLFNCSLYSINNSGSWVSNSSKDTTSVANATDTNFTSSTLNDNGTTGYKYNVYCRGHNVTTNCATQAFASANKTVFIDTIYPTQPAISNFEDGIICSDAIPQIEFNNATETNFQYYNITLHEAGNTTNTETTLWYNQYNSQNATDKY